MGRWSGGKHGVGSSAANGISGDVRLFVKICILYLVGGEYI
jgi:DNA gyrase/topoisomerase IV subunit B